jgi:site-specific DNA-methyltransferase (adenine-specific)
MLDTLGMKSKLGGMQRNLAQRGDALALLHSLDNGCATVAFFDPQYRESLDRLNYVNEGIGRQKERAQLPAMDTDYIDACGVEIARILKPSGYAFFWTDTFRLCQAHHLHLADALPTVGLAAWANGTRIGMGYRFRCNGGYLLALQKPPIRAKNTWTDRGISDRWIETVDRKLHPHAKPRGLTERLIGATKKPGDLIVDPAAGSFVVMHAALALGREFIGCDIAYAGVQA